jgi:hypothetical protein
MAHKTDTNPAKISRFEAHPVLTIIGICCAVLVALLVVDFICGQLLLKPVKGTISTKFHHDMKANIDFVDEFHGKHYHLHTDINGFKDFPLHGAGSQRMRRLLILGDSFAEGVGVANEDTFAGKLAQFLEPRGWEVLDGAVSSHSPKLYYLKLDNLLTDRRLKFDQLYVFIDISDVQDELFYEEFTPGQKVPLGPHARLFFRNNFYLLNKIVSQFDNINREAAFSKYGWDALTWQGERPLWTLNPGVFDRWGREGLDLCDRYMQKLVELCREHNLPLTIVVYPWPQQVRANDLNSLQVRHWESFSRSNGVRFINLFPLFIDVKRSGEETERFITKISITGDVHWNEAGHDLVAAALIRDWELANKAPEDENVRH